MDKYVLAPYVMCGFFNEELDIGFGSILLTIKDKAAQEAYLKTASFMKKPRTLEALKEFIKNDISADDKDALYENFLTKNFLIKEAEYHPEDRYSRDHLFYNLSGVDPLLIRQKLSEKHVVILGCGGIGNLVAANLATSGVGKLTLIDDDTIELSNLTRQILFCENDVGSQKTESLKKALQARNSEVSIQIETVACDNQEKAMHLPQCDLIVLSGDSPNICNHVNQFSYVNQIPFVNVGYIQDIACWGPFVIPGVTGCYECFSASNIANQKNPLSSLVAEINTNHKAPSFGAVNMLASAAATLDIVKFLGNFGEIQSQNRRVGIWTHQLKIEYQHYEKKQDCRLCCQ